LPDEILAAAWVGKSGAAWGNENLGVVYLSLPVQTCPEFEILNEVHHRMSVLKSSPEAFIVNASLRLMSAFHRYFPGRIELLFNETTNKASISYSNLKGPALAVKWPTDLATIKNIAVLNPPILKMGLMVNIVSYNNYISIGLTADQTASTDAKLKRLIGAFEESLSKFL
jgi:hypothetical protein